MVPGTPSNNQQSMALLGKQEMRSHLCRGANSKHTLLLIEGQKNILAYLITMEEFLVSLVSGSIIQCRQPFAKN
jgi:hypothetical protein